MTETIQPVKGDSNTGPVQNIYGVYFICCINNYLEVVEEQLSLLENGLLKITTRLIVFITNYSKEDVELNGLFSRSANKEKFTIITSDENLFERFAVNNYKKYISDSDYYLYYFHTKGVKPDNDPLKHIFTSRRQLLNFYTLEKYTANIKLLESFDAVGCSLNQYPKKHFSGNFWWSKSTYLRSLSDINDGYLSPEMYILSGEHCKYVSLANDTNDILIENYHFRDETTIIENITTVVNMNSEHQHLIRHC